MAAANTLTYYGTTAITSIKSFTVWAPLLEDIFQTYDHSD